MSWSEIATGLLVPAVGFMLARWNAQDKRIVDLEKEVVKLGENVKALPNLATAVDELRKEVGHLSNALAAFSGERNRDRD